MQTKEKSGGMQEKVQTIQVRQKTKTKSGKKRIAKKKKKKIYKQVKANNMRLMLHDCKINFMLMDNNSNTKID